MKNKFLIGLFGTLAGLTIGVTGGVLARDILPTDNSNNQNQQEQPEKPDTPTPDTPAQEALPFTFSGSEVTGYLGDATEVVIPTSYSLGGIVEHTLTATLDYSNEEDDMVGDRLRMDSEEIQRQWLEALGQNSWNYSFWDEFITEKQSDKVFVLTAKYKAQQYIVGDDVQVTSLKSGLFSNNNTITSVVVPEGISLGDYCFSGCSKLTNVELPQSITALPASCFNGCTSLAAIPVHITTLGQSALCGTAITEIPQNITSIGASAFESCGSLVNVTIPSGITTIPNSCFMNCKNLETVTMHNNVISIGSSAFRWCEALTAVSIPGSITSLPDRCFQDCKSLAAIPAHITSFGEYSMSGTAITEIPQNITSLSASAFESCKSLTEVVIPETITTIPYRCFALCSNLSSVTFHDKLVSVGEYAFVATGLTDISLPGSPTVRGNTFYNCKLNTITFLTTEWTFAWFTSLKTDLIGRVVIYVQPEVLSNYQSQIDEGWNIQAIPSSTEE